MRSGRKEFSLPIVRETTWAETQRREASRRELLPGDFLTVEIKDLLVQVVV